MFFNYLKIAFRGLIRNKLYTLISVFGLAVGVACCLLIFLFVKDELTFDRFHANADNIFRFIRIEQEQSSEPKESASTSNLLGGVLRETFPEVESVVRLIGSTQTIIFNNKSFTDDVALVDPDFLKMFSFHLIQGDASTALTKPTDLLVTPETAKKYFGDDDPMGKMLKINMGESQLDFSIVGVIEKAPSNSSIQYSFIIPMDHMKELYPERFLQSWGIVLFPTLVTLAPGTDPNQFAQNVAAHINSIFNEEDIGISRDYKLQKLTDIHLNTKYGGLGIPSSDPVYSYILAAIALAVLIIACINFTTLAVGRSSSRSREVGLRKVLGAQRKQLMKQFWGEAFILSAFAMFIAIIIAELSIDTFNNLAEKQLELNIFSDLTVIPALLSITVVTALLAGFYPAALISRLLPAESFRGEIVLGGKNRMVKTLVVLQFSISIFLIVCTLVVSSQMKYINNYDLGYDKEMVISFSTGAELEESLKLTELFKTEIADNPDVVNAAGYAYPFGQPWLYVSHDENNSVSILYGEDITGDGYRASNEAGDPYYYTNWTDYNFVPTMGINIIEGRNLSKEYPTDEEDAVLVNQALVKAYGWKNAIGQTLPGKYIEASVVGVFEDFHFYPLHRKVEPLVLHITRNDFITNINDIVVRMRSDDITGTIASLEKSWGKVSNGLPFNFKFFDEQLEEQYNTEVRWKQIVQYSSIFTFFVACLGLFGLTSLAVAKRTREVGIRKVMGAKVQQIVMMFSGDFVKLVMIALVIACPLAFFTMTRWLEDFTYRTEIGFMVFLLTGAIAVAITLLTVSLHAIKAGLTDPVKSLRHE